MKAIRTTALNAGNTGTATQISGGNGYTLTPGTGTGGLPIPMNSDNTVVGVGIACYVTGTVNYTVYHTYDNISDPAVIASNYAGVIWFQHGVSNMVAATGTQESNFVIPIGGVQVILNSGSGSVITTVLQQGII
jgi:hypothetical protein